MVTNYPGGIDSWDNPQPNTPEDAIGYEHDLLHGDLSDSITAIQTELGVNPSAAFSTVKQRFEDIESYLPKTTLYVPDPSMTLTYADEFDTYDPDWVYVYPAGKQNVVWTHQASGNGRICAYHPAIADAAGQMHCLLQPIDGGFVIGDAIETAFTLIGDTANYSMIGIGISNGTTHGTSSLIATQHYNGNYRVNYNIGMNADSGTSTGFIPPLPGPAPIWMRFVMTGTGIWRSDLSIDGYYWRTGNTYTMAFAPTHYGLVLSAWSTTKQFDAIFHFFRRYSGVS